jgi:hypothetical protein
MAVSGTSNGGGLCRFIGNRFLKKKVVHHHTSEQNVEWLYSFDVHCNSFIPMFMLLYGALHALIGFSMRCWLHVQTTLLRI